MRIYGPVPSRRFGLSLGVDIIPHKTCPFDCIYCQLGRTDRLTATLEEFYSIDEIMADVEEALADSEPLDVVTLAGSGDPTLYAGLGELIDRLKAACDAPVLLITNGALLWKEEVAAAALKADILAPSLDAGDEETFRRINCPHPEVTFGRLVEGLERVTNAHPGEVRLEIMLVAGVNDSDESIAAIAGLLPRFRFDRIDVNTPVRPPVPERGAMPCDEDALRRALEAFGPRAHAIGKFTRAAAAGGRTSRRFDDNDKDVREMLLRRPCTQEDIAGALGIKRHEVIKILERLVEAGLARSRVSKEGIYYHVPGKRPSNHMDREE